MNNENKKEVTRIVINYFSMIMDFRESETLAESIIDKVIEDIEETASGEFNYDDVCIALKRVLFSKFVEQ